MTDELIRQDAVTIVARLKRGEVTPHDLLDALEKRIREELEQFFVIVVMMTGKKVRVEGWDGPKAAKALIRKAVKAYDRGKK